MLLQNHTKLLVIPGGCTSVLQPLDVSINKPFKSYIREQWCEWMVLEAEKDVSKIKPAPKSTLLYWIRRAVELIERKPEIIQKSFRVTGIVGPADDIRNDVLYSHIQDTMTKVFGNVHMGYVQDNSDPFASDSNTCASGTSGEESDDTQ